MRPQTTNNLAGTLDVYRFSFESAGALELDNEHSEQCRWTGSLYSLRRARACMSLGANVALEGR